MEEEFAEFGAIDSEGFRTFSMTLEDGSEIARVSLHIDRISKKFPDYTNDEKNALLTAASIAAARNDSCLNDPQTVLTTIVQRLLPTLVAEQLQTYFPKLAKEALEVVTNACLKFALGGVVEMNGGPRVYDKETAEALLSPLTKTIAKEFLRVRAGRPAETWQRLLRTAEAVGRLKVASEATTREKVAEVLEVDAGTIGDWYPHLNCTWEEWVRASEMAGKIKNNFPAG